MKIYAPDYYGNFKCIADKCRHSCCIGWEIDVDCDTLAFYKSISGEFGKRLRESVYEKDGCASFALCEGEKCPFLNESGLCDIILELGEDALCRICADHPRFRNYFSDRVEMGLGLCCEKAAQMILKNEKGFELVLLDGNGDEAVTQDEADFFAFREKLFSLITDRSLALCERLDKMLAYCGITVEEKTNEELYDMYSCLERLDSEWDRELELLREERKPKPDLAVNDEVDNAFEQLAVYFLYRHLPSFFEEGDIYSGVVFSWLSVVFLMRLYLAHLEKDKSFGLNEIAEISRMYSSEIEYSDENIYALLEKVSFRHKGDVQI